VTASLTLCDLEYCHCRVLLNSEQKTSNYLVDHAATSNVGMLESDGSAAERVATRHPATDWLVCMQRRENVMRKLWSAMLGISLIALVCVIIGSALSSLLATQVT